jgi:hypothetical protein
VLILEDKSHNVAATNNKDLKKYKLYSIINLKVGGKLLRSNKSGFFYFEKKLYYITIYF